jgi:hypothetical protein
MVDRDESRAPATGKLPTPARVVVLDAACEPGGLDGPAMALAEAQAAGCRATLRLSGFSAPESAAKMLKALDARLMQEGNRLSPGALALSGAVPEPEALALGAAGWCYGAPAVYLLLPVAALEAIQRGRTVSLGGAEADARAWWRRLVRFALDAPVVSLVPEAPGPGVSSAAPGPRLLGPSH